MAEGKTIGSLLIKIIADAAQLRAGIKQSAADIKGFEKNLGMLKGAIIGAFSVGAITAFGKASLQSFQESERAVAKMTTALKGNQDQMRQLQELANQRQSVTVFSDEESLMAMARMRSIMGDNMEAIKRLLPLVQDLATVKEMGLSEAADLVAKSIATSTNALKRQGIEITGAAGSAERLESAVNALTEAFGGQAKALGDTLYGQLIKTRNAWDNIKESIGAVMAPVITESAKAWQYWAEVMTSNASAWEKFGTTFTRASKLVELYNEKYAELGNNLERIKRIGQVQMNPDGSFLMKKGESLTGSFGGGAKAPGFKRSIIPGTGNYSTPGMFDANAWNYRPSAKGPGQLQSIMPQGLESDMGMTSEWNQNYEKMVDNLMQLRDKIVSINQEVEASMESMVGSFASALGEMAATGKFNGNMLLDAFASMAHNLGMLAIKMGIAVTAIGKALQTMKGPVAVAAGVALVALAAAVRGSMSNIASGGGGGAISPQTSYGTQGGSYYRQYNQADKEVITVKVVGEISGEVIRLANQRAILKHNAG